MSAYIQALDRIEAQKLAVTTAVTDKAKAEETTPFSAVFDSAMKLIQETNDLQSAAEAEEINMTLGYAKNAHDLTNALNKAELAINYTVAIKNKILEAYREIMNIQI